MFDKFHVPSFIDEPIDTPFYQYHPAAVSLKFTDIQR